MCEWFDETCGTLMDGLDRRGLTDNTIIIDICDNGWAATCTPAAVSRFSSWSSATAA
jgi:arylsulfatase A-like enzyme